MGGGNRRRKQRVNPSGGLSPRGRGKRGSHRSYSRYSRSIPAWAGETPADEIRLKSHKVYPRVGGGNRFYSRRPQQEIGLSPRGRGKQWIAQRIDGDIRSIPAWAGETSRSTQCAEAGAVYPRVGGGNGGIRESQKEGSGLSPRGRGKR